MGDAARRLAAAGHDVVNLGSGSPDLPTPDHAVAAAREALADGETVMTRTPGIDPLREAVADRFAADGIDATPDRVTVTPGSKFALFAAVQTLLRPGDEAVVLDPSWVSYRAMVAFAGGDLSPVRLSPPWSLDDADPALETVVSDDTRLLVLNTPANPTGAVLSRADLERIRDLAVAHDCWVLSDEIYARLTHAGAPDHVAPASLDGMAERTVTTGGLSKAYAMSGWRLGYLTGPEPVVDAVRRLQSQTTSAATTFAQHGAVAALRGPDEPIRAARETYADRLDAARDVLADAGLDVPRPDAAFYLFVPVGIDDDVALAEALLEEHHVATTPGSAFGTPGHLRIACTVPEDRLVDALDRIADRLVAGAATA